jgi:hypothetical protein
MKKKYERAWAKYLQARRFERHRKLFMKRRRQIGFHRWMAMRYRGSP